MRLSLQESRIRRNYNPSDAVYGPIFNLMCPAPEHAPQTFKSLQRSHLLQLPFSASCFSGISPHFHPRSHCSRRPSIWENLMDADVSFDAARSNNMAPKQQSQANVSVLRAASDLRTLSVDQPSLNAASCASNSPKPSISPLTNGSNKFIAAPRSRDQNVGGW